LYARQFLLKKMKRKFFGFGSPASFSKEPDAESLGFGGAGLKKGKREKIEKNKFFNKHQTMLNLPFESNYVQFTVKKKAISIQPTAFPIHNRFCDGYFLYRNIPISSYSSSERSKQILLVSSGAITAGSSLTMGKFRSTQVFQLHPHVGQA
jgi:hypothetical protein